MKVFTMFGVSVCIVTSFMLWRWGFSCCLVLLFYMKHFVCASRGEQFVKCVKFLNNAVKSFQEFLLRGVDFLYCFSV